MEFSTVLSSRAIRFFFVDSPAGGVYLPQGVRLLQEKFGFLHAPTTLDEFDASKGILFKHGSFDDVVIDALEIFNDGVVVHTKANTDLSDKFIDTLIEFNSKEFNFIFKEIPHRQRMYNSELEIRMDKDIASVFERFSGAYNIINETMSQHADEIPDVKAIGLSIGCDMFFSPYLKPALFTLERRGGNSFDTNFYFSRAPLPTDIHLQVLEEIEKSI